MYYLLLILPIVSGLLQDNVMLGLPIAIDGVLQATKVALDANWRWTHHKDDWSKNCFPGATWDRSICQNPEQCARDCLVEGVPKEQWESPYGISASSNSLTLRYVTKGQYSTNIGSRVYLVDPSGQSYYALKVLGKRFSFTVDVSKLPCGLNGALYAISMPLNGIPDKGGAAFGTGYCDAQCPKDIKWMQGRTAWANTNNTGICCSEYDFWEANSKATQAAPHACIPRQYTLCTSDKTCGEGSNRHAGICDKDGSDFNHYRNGDRDLYGGSIDTSKPIRVSTEFHTDSSGDLVKIVRYYEQGGKRLEGFVQTDSSIEEQKKKFGEVLHTQGGLKQMGVAMKDGMVLALSLWDDSSPAQMAWLDGTYGSGAGKVRGPCPASGRDPNYLRNTYPSAQVVYSELSLDLLDTPVTSPPVNQPSRSPTLKPSSRGYWKCNQCVYVK
jgi:cellulose 1,4-beta-cellobiosidase